MAKAIPAQPAASIPSDNRPPYLAAAIVFVVVLAVYVWTLAPTVTFWDAGEFIATAKILGIPHPPGTPLFVLLGNVFGNWLPVGEFAYRTNLMTALFSAGGAALFFLLVVQALRGWGQWDAEDAGSRSPIYSIGGAVAAALISAFAFTVWQNSNETEVYMVATFSIAAICWLAWLWRTSRATERGAHVLLLIVYLAAVSIGNHLLTLLVGPALIAFMWHVLRTEPLRDEVDRRAEWAQWAVLTGMWALLIGAGLGSTGLLVLGGVAFAAAAVYAGMVGSLPFALMVLAIGGVGFSTYAFLYLRAGLDPFINEADPSTWDALLSVIRREQYPPRSPIDNPIYPSGPDNPGRSLTIMWLQLQNYLQYFDWQWANGLAPTQPVFALPRIPFTLLFTGLGIYGGHELYRRDRSVFWLVAVLFLTTGPGLMGYMNFKPGYSVGFEQFADGEMHEVRERDYFFTVSFLTWGLLAGIGLAGIVRQVLTRIQERGAAVPPRLAAAVFVIALVPLTLNFRAASRAHGPEATLARDFAYDLLQSAEPYGIVFTNGDNDTFPLWYAQEVEGIRQDVSVVNLSLGNTDWYLRQLRDNPVRPFDPEQAPWFAELAPATPPGRLHNWSDDQIATLYPRLLDRPFTFRAGRVERTLPANSPLYVKDFLMLKLIQDNLGTRPLYWSITAGNGNWVGLGEFFVNEALVHRLHNGRPDTVDMVPSGIHMTPNGRPVLISIPRTRFLVDSVYRYAALFDVERLDLDPTNRNIAFNLSTPLLALGQAYEMLGDREQALEFLRRGERLMPSVQLKALIAELANTPPGLDSLLGDTALSGGSQP